MRSPLSRCVSTFALLLSLPLAAAAFQRDCSELDFYRAFWLQQNTREVEACLHYARFLAEHPDSELASEARTRLSHVRASLSAEQLQTLDDRRETFLTIEEPTTAAPSDESNANIFVDSDALVACVEACTADWTGWKDSQAKLIESGRVLEAQRRRTRLAIALALREAKASDRQFEVRIEQLEKQLEIARRAENASLTEQVLRERDTVDDERAALRSAKKIKQRGRDLVQFYDRGALLDAAWLVFPDLDSLRAQGATVKQIEQVETSLLQVLTGMRTAFVERALQPGIPAEERAAAEALESLLKKVVGLAAEGDWPAAQRVLLAIRHWVLDPTASATL